MFSQPNPVLFPRRDYEIIAAWVETGSRILDIGCGDGALLDYLSGVKKIVPQGIEKDWETALHALNRGLPVLIGGIDENLDLITSKNFDMIIISKTVQELIDPHTVIDQMLSKGKTVVISFLNYGYWFNRLFFLSWGRRPRNEALPYSWYDSPDLHPLSIKDFEDYCQDQKITILQKVYLKGDWKRESRLWPNFLAGYAFYHLKKD